MKLLLDTNICIYLIKKHPPGIAERFAQYRKGEVGISSITWAELCCGISKDGDDAVERLLALLAVSPFGIPEGRWYGNLTAQLPDRKANLDRMIAAHALSLDATLVTNNEADFEVYRPFGLRVENWISGPGKQ